MMISKKKKLPVYRTYSHGERYGLICAGELGKEGVATDTLWSKYPFYCLVLVLAGRGRYEDETGFKAELRKGTVLQRLPDRKHSVRIYPDSHWHELFIGFGLMDFTYEARREPGDFWKADLMHPHCNRTLDCLDELSLPLRDIPCFSLSGGEEILADRIRDFSAKLERAEPEVLPLLSGETALELGYEDTSSFSKQFRRVMGLSPGEYLRR